MALSTDSPQLQFPHITPRLDGLNLLLNYSVFVVGQPGPFKGSKIPSQKLDTELSTFHPTA